MEMAVKTAERGSVAAQGGGGAGGAGTPFPAAGKLGERRPLASLLHGFLEPSPMEMGSIHGGGKNVAFGGCNSWVEVSSTN